METEIKRPSFVEDILLLDPSFLAGWATSVYRWMNETEPGCQESLQRSSIGGNYCGICTEELSPLSQKVMARIPLIPSETTAILRILHCNMDIWGLAYGWPTPVDHIPLLRMSMTTRKRLWNLSIQSLILACMLQVLCCPEVWRRTRLPFLFIWIWTSIPYRWNNITIEPPLT